MNDWNLEPHNWQEQTHYVFYFEEDGRQCWECETCSSGGSVGEFGDPELAAERAHGFPVVRRS